MRLWFVTHSLVSIFAFVFVFWGICICICLLGYLNLWIDGVSEWERERGVEPVAEIPDWMVIRLSDGSPEREQLISDRNYKSTKIHMTDNKNTNKLQNHKIQNVKIRLSDGSPEREELISDQGGELESKTACHRTAFAQPWLDKFADKRKWCAQQDEPTLTTKVVNSFGIVLLNKIQCLFCWQHSWTKYLSGDHSAPRKVAMIWLITSATTLLLILATTTLLDNNNISVHFSLSLHSQVPSTKYKAAPSTKYPAPASIMQHPAGGSPSTTHCSDAVSFYRGGLPTRKSWNFWTLPELGGGRDVPLPRFFFGIFLTDESLKN